MRLLGSRPFHAESGTVASALLGEPAASYRDTPGSRGIVRVVPAGSPRSVGWVELVKAGSEKVELDAVVGEHERFAVGGVGLVKTVQPCQELGAGGGKIVVAGQLWFRAER